MNNHSTVTARIISEYCSDLRFLLDEFIPIILLFLDHSRRNGTQLLLAILIDDHFHQLLCRQILHPISDHPMPLILALDLSLAAFHRRNYRYFQEAFLDRNLTNLLDMKNDPQRERALVLRAPVFPSLVFKGTI